MLDIPFSGLYESVSGLTVSAFLICIGAALLLGILVALVGTWRMHTTRSFTVTLAMLPAIVCAVIMMVNGNLGAGVAVAGAFSLIRFRSAPGTAREICAIFLAMSVGLACGMGYPGFAALFAVVMCLASVVLTLVNFGGKRDAHLHKVLHITVPEDLDYGSIFRDILDRYTAEAVLVSIKTTNLGSLNRLTYDVVLKDAGSEKEMIDALRCRNGNLEISLSYQPTESRDL